MPEVPSQEKATIKLEQLLRLKRSERPDRSFWEEFDREFQRRRLATMVTAPPWYVRVGRAVMILLRRTAPIGAAAAAIAGGFFAIQKSHTDSVVSLQLSEVEQSVHPTLLPEEHIAVRNIATNPKPASDLSSVSAVPRYAVNEIGTTPRSTGHYVTIAAPFTLSISQNDAEVYRIRTMATSPAFGASAQPVAGSL